MSQTVAPGLHQLPPLANLIVDRALDNTQRKLVAGFRNKKNSRPNAKDVDVAVVVSDTLNATKAESVIAVANRGIAWREMIQKSLSHGISSLSTAQFDGEFTIKDGKPNGLDKVPETPGVYVVFSPNGQVDYVGDSGNLKSRWRDGHLNKHNEDYKLAGQIEEGCTVRFIKMDSVETAAAVEAHWIKEIKDKKEPLVNKREELKEEQGKRSNIEAKKMKDASDSTSSLLGGAATEVAKNVGWQTLERLTSAFLKALKTELVDIFAGGKSTLAQRVKRFTHEIWAAVQSIVETPLKMVAGLIEFIVNAFSKTISQIYGLARNLFDLANGAWNLYRGAKTMNNDDLVQKVSETIITSGCLVLWDALDPILEAQLLPILGPFAPYVACVITAIGFGLSSFYLQKIVPAIVDFVVTFKSGWSEALEAKRRACLQLIELEENEWTLVSELRSNVQSIGALIDDMPAHARTLSEHDPVKRIDMQALRARLAS